MRGRIARLTGALVALVIIATACGDDDDVARTAEPAADDATPAPTTEEPVREGDGDAATAADGDEDMAADGHEDMAAGGDDHDHGEGIEVPEGMPVPEIAIEVVPDPISGHNLFLDLANFTIAPEHASGEPIDGEGHLHLYLDGERTARFYNTAMHLALEPGVHTVMVEVSANNHAPYTMDGNPIMAMATVTVADMEHAHMEREPVEAIEPIPEVALSVTEDPKSGWNLAIDVANFTIAPEKASTDHVDGEGHLHLYVDGEKITRLYGTDWHLPALSEGEHDLVVELSANDHSPYVHEGRPIVATASVSVSAAQASDSAAAEESHDHDHDGTAMEEGDGAAVTEADVVIDVAFDGDTVEVADDRVDVARGGIVALTVTSQVDDRVHVHGYDLYADVVAGETAALTFVADIPGVFELEFEDSGRFIAEVAVQ